VVVVLLLGLELRREQRGPQARILVVVVVVVVVVRCNTVSLIIH
jgi:hypothetical protein